MKKILIRNFKMKLALFIFIAALLPISALEIISAYDGMKYEQHIVEYFSDIELEGQLGVFDYWLSNKQENISSMILVLERHLNEDASNEVISETLDLFLNQDRDILNTYYTNQAGLDLLCRGQEGIVDGRNRKWYKNAVNKVIAVSHPYIDGLTGKHVITISHVVLKDGEIEGVLGIDVLLSDVMTKFFTSYNSVASELIVLDDAGKVLFQSSYFPDEVISHFQIMKQGYNNGFQKQYVFRKRIDSLETRLLIILDREKLFNGSMMHKDFNRQKLLLGFYFIAAIIVISYVTARRVTRPILELEEQVKNIVEGVPQEVKYLGFKDLNQIIMLFQEFQRTIIQNKKSILNMRSELEERNKTLLVLNSEYEKAYGELEKFSKELSEKEGAYEDLVENIVDLIWAIDANGQITYCNEKFLELLGYEEQELLGMLLSDVVPSFKMSYCDRPYELLYLRDYDAIDMKFVDRSGKKVVLTSTSTTRIFQNDQLLSIQGVSRDVTTEKKMYSELNSRNRDLMLINKISKEMTMTGNLNSVLDLVLENVDELLEVHIATIRFLDDDGQLKVRAFKGQEDALLWSSESKDALVSHIGYAIENRQAVVLNSLEDVLVETDENFIKSLESGYKVAILPLLNKERTFGALSILAVDLIDDRCVEVLSAFANSTSVALERATLFETLENNYLKTIEMLVSAMDAKNSLMQGHSNRVSQMAEYIGRKLYLSADEIKDLYIAALLHDVGKIGLQDAILRQDLQIDLKNISDEITVAHIEIGNRILEPIGLKQEILDGVYYHHKYFNQKGYPETVLSEVPLYALIIGVADDIDIMVHRNKNNLYSIEDVKNVLQKGSGLKYSPEIVNLVIELLDKKDEELLTIINR